MQRYLIALFARGAIGEHLQSAVMPWSKNYERPGKEALLARHIEEIWRQMEQEWRFFGAVDSANGNVVMTVPTLGWLGLQGRGKVHEDEEEDDNDEHMLDPGTRKLILLWAAGAVGEHLQSGVLPWRKTYEERGREAEIASDVEAVWTQMTQTWSFFGAIDSATGDIVTSVPAFGWLALQRVRAHDALAMVDDAPPEDEPGAEPKAQ